MADLVPVRRGTQAPARAEDSWPQRRPDPFFAPFREFDELWDRMVGGFFGGPIGGEIRERDRAGVLRHRARHTGTFRYATTLPAGVDADRVEARFENGVLTVRVPRPESSRPRQIKIN
jgi:hypothetical protein